MGYVAFVSASVNTRLVCLFVFSRHWRVGGINRACHSRLMKQSKLLLFMCCNIIPFFCFTKSSVDVVSYSTYFANVLGKSLIAMKIKIY